jgi:hypothetical protein
VASFRARASVASVFQDRDVVVGVVGALASARIGAGTRVAMRGGVRFIVVAVVVAVAVSRAAAADPTQPPDDKDPAIAYVLSVGGTLAPFAIGAIAYGNGDENAPTRVLVLGGLSMMFLPSAGHWYAGQAWTWGTTARVAGAATVALLGLYYIACEDCDPHTGGTILGVTGAALVVGGVVYDIATAGTAVHRWNDQHRGALTPTVVRTGTCWGVGIGGTF